MTQKVQTDLFGNVIVSDEENVYVNSKPKKQKDLSDEIETEYLIEVVCKDEKHQEEMYNELTKRGLVCRVLTL